MNYLITLWFDCFTLVTQVMTSTGHAHDHVTQNEKNVDSQAYYFSRFVRKIMAFWPNRKRWHHSLWRDDILVLITTNRKRTQRIRMKKILLKNVVSRPMTSLQRHSVYRRDTSLRDILVHSTFCTRADPALVEPAEYFHSTDHVVAHVTSRGRTETFQPPLTETFVFFPKRL